MSATPRTGQATGRAGAIATTMSGRTIRASSRLLMRGKVDLSVDGLDHIPATGPVVIAARHYHHLFDGTSIVTTVPRPLKIMVALDWVQAGAQRRMAEGLCRTADWPVVLRPDAEKYRPELAADPARVARYQADTTRDLKRAAAQGVDILTRGEGLLVFPEGYPNIDPSFTPKSDDPDDFMPFLPGAVRVPLLAQSTGLAPVPIVPAGLRYRSTGEDRWAIQLRFGEPMTVTDRRDAHAAVERRGARIWELSRPG